MERGDLLGAAQRYRMLLTRSDDEHARLTHANNLAVSLYRLGYQSEAERWYVHVFENGSVEDAALALGQIHPIFVHQRRYQDLFEFSSRLARRVSRGDSAGQEVAALVLWNVANSLHEHGEVAGSLRLFELVVDLLPEPEYLFKAGLVRAQVGDFPRALAHFASVAERAGPNSSDYYKARFYQGDALEASRNREEALTFYEEASKSADLRVAALSLERLGTLHDERGDLEAAISTFRELWRMPGEEGSARGAQLLVAALVKAERWGEVLEPARDLARRAPHAGWAALQLGVAYRQLGRGVEANDSLRRAVTEGSEDIKSRAALELGKALEDEGNWREAVEMYQQVTSTGSDDTHVQAWYRAGRLLRKAGDIEHSVGAFYEAASLRYRTGTLALLELARATREAGNEQLASAMVSRLKASADIAEYAAELGIRDLFAEDDSGGGQPEFVNTLIDGGVTGPRGGKPTKAEYLSLTERCAEHLVSYRTTGDLAELERAADLALRAANDSPPGSADRIRASEAAGWAQLTIAVARRDMTLADAGVRFLNDALRWTLPGEPTSARILTELSSGLTRLADRLDEDAAGSDGVAGPAARQDLLDHALWAQHQAVEADRRAGTVHELAGRYRSRFRAAGAARDLRKAVVLYRESIDLSHSDSELRMVASANLASALADLGRVTGDATSADELSDLFRAGCGIRDPELLVGAARAWTVWALGARRFEDVSEAAGLGWAAATELFHIQTRRRDQEARLRDGELFVVAGALAQAAQDEADEATITIEAGIARLLAEESRRRKWLEDAGTDEELRTALEEVRRLESIEREASGPSGDDVIPRLQAARRRLVGLIGPPADPAEQRETSRRAIRAAASTSPLLYLLATPARGMALLVKAGGQITARDLPTLNDEFLDDALGEYLEPVEHDDIVVAATALRNLASWLWERIVSPLQDDLVGIEELTVIPTGRLRLAPLHAAVTMDGDGSLRYLIDGVTLRYSINAQSAVAHATKLRDLESRSVLVVEVPEAPGEESLRHTESEVHALRVRCDPAGVVHLDGMTASKSRVVDHLRDAAIAHFSCHGFGSPDEPLSSGLSLLGGEVLTVSDVLALDLTSKPQIVLSACQTAVIGYHNPNEVIGLPGAFTQAGASGVIGSLWSVFDEAAGELISRFYEYWLEMNVEPSRALRRAMIEVKEQGGDRSDPLWWASFCYHGV